VTSTAVAATQASVAQAQPAPKQTQPLDQNALEDRRGAVESEIGRLGRSHPWAGEYISSGTDTSDRLAVAPETGYVVTHRGMGSRNGPAESIRECGRVRFADGVLTLEPEFSSNGNSKSPQTLISVRWGNRRYLIYESSITSFCNGVNSGQEQLRASRASWTRNRDAEVNGKPELPAQYQSFIFDEPLVAKIVSKSVDVRTDEHGNSYGTLVFDVGRNRGAFERMRLFRNPADGKIAIVDSVHETTCEASCVGGKYFNELPLGAEFTTRRQSP
jgi:hypothetical protein